jgi:hypothetical protein
MASSPSASSEFHGVVGAPPNVVVDIGMSSSDSDVEGQMPTVSAHPIQVRMDLLSESSCTSSEDGDHQSDFHDDAVGGDEGGLSDGKHASDEDYEPDWNVPSQHQPPPKKAKPTHTTEMLVSGGCNAILHEADGLVIQCPCVKFTHHSVTNDGDTGRDISCTCTHSITCHSAGDAFGQAKPTSSKLGSGASKPSNLLMHGGESSTKYAGIAKGIRPSRDKIVGHLETAASREDAFGVKCTCKERNCKRNLFTYEGSKYDDAVDGLKSLRNEFWEKNQNERGTYVFNALSNTYKHYEWDGDGNPIGKKRFAFYVNDKPVCLSVWMAMHGMSKSLYIRMRKRVLAGALTAYDERGKTDAEKEALQTAQKWMGVVAYIVHYGNINGDYMPDRDRIVLPHIDLKTWHEEYKSEMELAGFGEDQICKYEYFDKVWLQEPMLRKYEISNLKYNFQKCSICIALSTKIAKAQTDKERHDLKCQRCSHLTQCKAERVHYDVHKHEAVAGLCTSLCLDGWSIFTTTCPHPTVNSKDLDKLGGLQLKVTGVIVHGGPASQFVKFYVSDPSVAHDVNLNIEVCFVATAMVGGNPAMQVIRRTLLEIQSRGGKIHSKLCIQTDNASDNKSKHMFAFLMMLVKEKITDEVILSMLIVGHTVS